MTKFKNTFRIETTRLKDWDYSTPWWYYVTINTKNHTEYFGKVVNSKIIVNELGNVVEKFWNEIPNHFANVELDFYVLMPNHIHGIIIINPTVGTHNLEKVETPDRASLQRFTLGQIINQFKGSVKRWSNKNSDLDFSWQPRFYDRIIRNEKELFNIRKYIEQNPLKWELEKDQPENIFDY